jgi:transcriptional regulator with XRE-family HTH domain
VRRKNQNLKLAIVATDQSQRQVGADCGIHEDRLSQIVNGWITPREDECERLARVLGRTVDELFSEEPGRP